MAITRIAIAETTGILSFRKTTHKSEHIAPDVFSIGSEMDSSINRIPKYENTIDPMYRRDTGKYLSILIGLKLISCVKKCKYGMESHDRTNANADF